MSGLSIHLAQEEKITKRSKHIQFCWPKFKAVSARQSLYSLGCISPHPQRNNCLVSGALLLFSDTCSPDLRPGGNRCVCVCADLSAGASILCHSFPCRPASLPSHLLLRETGLYKPLLFPALQTFKDFIIIIITVELDDILFIVLLMLSR